MKLHNFPEDRSKLWEQLILDYGMYQLDQIWFRTGFSSSGSVPVMRLTVRQLIKEELKRKLRETA